MTERLDRDEARRLSALTQDFEARRSTVEEVAGVIAAIPAPVAQALLALGWRVDDAGAWVSPRDDRVLPWREALEQEVARAG
jgi:hypothetical protein